MIQADGTAPYAPPKTVIDLVERYRDKGLRTPFDLDVLGQAGISSGLAPRVLQALRLLDLIDSDGNPTPALESLRKASTDDFRSVLAEVVREAYADVFNFVDPAEDTTDAISDAFRSYNPPGQRGRMVTLFIGLCREAGIIDWKPPPRAGAVNGAKVPAHQRATRSRPLPARRSSSRSRSGVPAQIEALLDTLPDQDEGWSRGRRDQFVAAFTAILDYTYPLREQLPPGAAGADEGGDS